MNVPAVGTTSSVKPVETTGAPPARVGTQKTPEPARASEPLNLSGTAVAARALAASPPVDEARVAALKTAIADGSYAAEPERIAAKMIALDLP